MPSVLESAQGLQLLFAYYPVLRRQFDEQKSFHFGKGAHTCRMQDPLRREGIGVQRLGRQSVP
jgi:hypothetical protein